MPTWPVMNTLRLLIALTTTVTVGSSTNLAAAVVSASAQLLGRQALGVDVVDERAARSCRPAGRRRRPTGPSRARTRRPANRPVRSRSRAAPALRPAGGAPPAGAAPRPRSGLRPPSVRRRCSVGRVQPGGRTTQMQRRRSRRKNLAKIVVLHRCFFVDRHSAPSSVSDDASAPARRTVRLAANRPGPLCKDVASGSTGPGDTGLVHSKTCTWERYCAIWHCTPLHSAAHRASRTLSTFATGQIKVFLKAANCPGGQRTTLGRDGLN